MFHLPDFRRFYIGSGSVGAAIIAIHLVTAFFFANGKYDAYYLRFATPKANSMIIGSSRAAHGIIPAILNESILKKGYDTPIFNNAYSIGHSPYGPGYYTNIKRKMDPSTKNGLFIVTIDPWSLMNNIANINDDPDLFPENKLCVTTTKNVDIHPNLEYLYENQLMGWGELITENFKYNLSVRLYNSEKILKLKEKYPAIEKLLPNSISELHENGWLEVTTLNHSVEFFKKRTIVKSKTYENYRKNYVFSETRFKYLDNICTYLSMYGRVYLVRMPVSKELKSIEDNFVQDFDERILKLSKKMNTEYLNFSQSYDRFIFTDGNHLYKESAKKFSVLLSNQIK